MSEEAPHASTRCTGREDWGESEGKATLFWILQFFV